MEKYLKAALYANKASLGFHWIYNSEYLEVLAKTESLLFQKQSKMHYDNAQPSYYVYPDSEHTLQGMMLIWLYEALSKNKDFSRKDYEDMLYEKLRPGGAYVGYVESYTKKLVIKRLSREVNVDVEDFKLVDDHLVGFVPYLVCEELGLGNKKAWDLAQAFTTLEAYPKYYEMFDHIFEHIGKKDINDVLTNAIELAPSEYQDQLSKAIDMDDTKAFIKEYAGIACQIPQSIPLIIHMLTRVKSFEEMLHWNTRIGGASSDRGLLLGALLSKISTIETI